MATETLRPNGAGDEENVNNVVGDGVGSHWVAVDEATPDDDASYVYGTSEDYHRDLYALADHSAGQGTITKITVYGRFEAINYVPTWDSAKLCIKTGGTVYEQSFQLATYNVWYDLSKEWTLNPNTGAAWAWSEIDALQVGCSLRRPKTGVTCRTKCTQLYVVVEYTPGEDKTSAETGSGQDISMIVSADMAVTEGGQGQEVAVTEPSFKFSSDGGQAQETGATPQGGKTSSEGGSVAEAVSLAKGESSGDAAIGTDSLVVKNEAPSKGGGMKLWT